ncbi:MAG: EscU/YscU/HrcU family type III secretion system export apparatus switch protein [Spirochaetia bacterium]
MEKAAAVKYIEGLPAPFLVAKGRGELAKKILRLAEENDITVHHDAGLTEEMYRLDPGEWIPEELFEAVARLLAFVYNAQREIG